MQSSSFVGWASSAMVMAVLLCGCAFTPIQPLSADSDLGEACESVAPIPYRIAIAPVLVHAGGTEPPDEGAAYRWSSDALADPEQMQADLARLIDGLGLFERVEVVGDVAPKTREDALLTSAEELDCDFLLRVDVVRHQVGFLEHGSMWWLNVLNFLATGFFDWWVRDETFAARSEVQVRVVYTRSGKSVYTKRFTGEHVVDLNDFHLGWKPFLLFRVPGALEGDDLAAERLSSGIAPHALRAVWKQMALDLLITFAPFARGEEFERLRHKGVEARQLALVVGVDRFAHRDIERLHYAAADARALATLLTDPGLGRFRSRDVTLLVNAQATREAVLSSLAGLEGRRTVRGDRVVVFFAGYGAAASGEAFLCPHDTDPARLHETAISLEDLSASLDRVASEQLVVLLDASFSGGVGGRTLAAGAGSGIGRDSLYALLRRVIRRPGRVLLTAGDADEVALEFEPVRQGLFTHYLLSGARGRADANGDGQVLLREAFDHLTEAVEKQSVFLGFLQHPQWYCERRFDFVLAAERGAANEE